MKSYVVLEQHFGDKQYWAGDTRELLEDDAADLIALGLISESANSESANSESANSESANSESEVDKDKSLGDSPKNKDEPVTPAGKESESKSKDNPDPEGNSKDGKN